MRVDVVTRDEREREGQEGAECIWAGAADRWVADGRAPTEQNRTDWAKRLTIEQKSQTQNNNKSPYKCGQYLFLVLSTYEFKQMH